MSHRTCGPPATVTEKAADTATLKSMIEGLDMEPLLDGLPAVQPGTQPHIVVIGDLLAYGDCLDTLVQQATTDGQEPIPSASCTWLPGGAGAAAKKAAADGNSVTLVTAHAEDDEPALIIRHDLEAAGIAVVGLDTATPIPVVMRLLEAGLTVETPDGPTVIGSPSMEVANSLASADAVLVVDHRRGVAAQPHLRALITAVARRVPVLWDLHEHSRTSSAPGAVTARAKPEVCDDQQTGATPGEHPNPSTPGAVEDGAIAHVLIVRSTVGVLGVGAQTGPLQLVLGNVGCRADEVDDHFAVELLKALMTDTDRTVASKGDHA